MSDILPTLKERIQSDVKTAMKSGDKTRLGTLRLMLAAIKQREVDERIALDDPGIVVVLDKMLKQRRESITQYEQGRRQDLADVERGEITVIQAYLPQPLNADEVAALIDDALQQTGASVVADIGKVMAILKPQLQGRADMATVSKTIRDRLSA